MKVHMHLHYGRALSGSVCLAALLSVLLSASGCVSESEPLPPCDPVVLWEDGLREAQLDESILPAATVDGLTAAQLLPPNTQAITLSNANSAVLAALASQTALKQLTFGANPQLVAGDLQRLTAFTALERLNLSGLTLTDAHIGELPQLSSVKELSILAASGIGINSAVSLSSCPALEKLHLTSSAVNDQWLPHLATISTLTQLTLSGITGLSQTGLSSLATMTSLEELALSGCGLLNAAIAPLASSPNLRWLQLDDNASLTQQGIEVLQSIATLRTLWVRQCGANDAWLTTLGSFTQLQELRIDGTFQSTFFGSLTNLTDLRRLSLSGASIVDAAMLHVSGILSLELLDLSRTSVTGVGLGQLQSMPNLRRFIMIDGGLLDSQGANFLSQVQTLESLTLGGVSASMGATGWQSLTIAGRLRVLELYNTSINEDDLRLLRRLNHLRRLKLVGVSGVDGGFVSTLVSDGSCLERLSLEFCSGLTESALRFTPRLRNLRRLSLRSSSGRTTATVNRIAECALLERLDLSQSSSTTSPATFSDSSLRRLVRPESLASLNVRQTVPTRSGAVDHLRANAPHVSIAYGE